MAVGTSASPIVFTSDKPKGQRSYGDWGGVVICGNGLTNKHDPNTGSQVSLKVVSDQHTEVLLPMTIQALCSM